MPGATRAVRRRGAEAGRGVRLGAATAVAAIREQAPPAAEAESHSSLFQPGHMRRRLDQLIETNKRYGHPFGLVVFDVDGPGARRR